MGSPYLNSDESIILSTHNILIDAAVSEMILTNRRLLIVDSGNVRFQHKEMSFAAIETVTTMESGSGDPAISLAVFAKSGGTNLDPSTLEQATSEMLGGRFTGIASEPLGRHLILISALAK